MLVREESSGDYLIKSYDDQGFIINHSGQEDLRFDGPMMLSPKKAPISWCYSLPTTLSEDHIQALIAHAGEKPDMILLGLGSQWIMPPIKILEYCHGHNIGVECMDTAAACRTYPILSADGVTMVAGLIPAGCKA